MAVITQNHKQKSSQINNKFSNPNAPSVQIERFT